MIRSMTKPPGLRRLRPPEEPPQEQRVQKRQPPHVGFLNLVEESLNFGQHASGPGGPLAAGRYRR